MTEAYCTACNCHPCRCSVYRLRDQNQQLQVQLSCRDNDILSLQVQLRQALEDKEQQAKRIDELDQHLKYAKTIDALVKLAAITAERDAALQSRNEWIRENGPGGWIDELRKRAESSEPRVGQLETLLRAMRDHASENALSWRDSGGSHHYPIWLAVATALDGSASATDPRASNAIAALAQPHDIDKFGVSASDEAAVDALVRRRVGKLEAHQINHQPQAEQIDADYRPALTLCSDCPPAGYPSDKTRCKTCPLRAASPEPRDEDEETPCQVREDGLHCECWYGGNPCCGCQHQGTLGVAWASCAEIRGQPQAQQKP